MMRTFRQLTRRPGVRLFLGTGLASAVLCGASGTGTVDWPYTSGERSGSHYSPLRQIHAGNVKQLGLAWSYDTGTTRGLEATPIVVGGTMYTSLSWSVAVALDAATGKLKWRHDPRVPHELGSRACCDVVNRGVALDNGKVFIGTLDGRLQALDAATGRLLWSVETTDPGKHYTITGAPRVVKGMVIIGNGGAEYGVRGYVSAYDAATGKLVWRFYTVPGNPAEKIESEAFEKALKTWSGEWWKLGGGGTVWDAIEYDPQVGLLYIGTGNGSPWNRNFRSPGGGDNLYLSSIVALRPDTGAYVWHYQVTPGDSWDFTATQPMILADLRIAGATRKVLMQAPKNGFFYVLDRVSGELLSAEPFAKTTWATRIDMATGRPVETPEARYGEQPVLLLPSPMGAHNWHPMSYHQGLNLVFLPTSGIPFAYSADPRVLSLRGHGWRLGVDLAPGGKVIVPAAHKEKPDDPPGSLLAWDPVAAKPRWRVAHKSWCNGGVLSTAGDIVFQGRGDGNFSAYSAQTGDKLWEVFLGNGIVAAPSTYSIGGTQYVSILAGYGGIGLNGLPALDTYKAPGRLWAFALNANAKLTPVAGQPRPSLTPIEAAPVPGQIGPGAQAYHRNCTVCHGINAVSSGSIADLRYASQAVFDNYRHILLDGALAKVGMPSFKDALTPREVEAIRSYVLFERSKLEARK